jgi:hypothetical protein
MEGLSETNQEAFHALVLGVKQVEFYSPSVVVCPTYMFPLDSSHALPIKKVCRGLFFIMHHPTIDFESFSRGCF